MKTITAKELKIKFNEVLLIDVRESFEHHAECIEGSCLIPLSLISVKKIPLQSKPIVIYCRSGIRSVTACQKLLQEDPSLDLSSLEGGIIAWKELL